MTLAEDLAIYLPRPGRSHPLERYARAARLAPGSDEAIVLEAMRRARFSLWRVERRHETTGLILRDLLRGEETWLVDEAMEKNAPPGVEMAARLLQPEGFAMTARIIVPLTPDLREQVFARAPVLSAPRGTPSPGTRTSRSASTEPRWPQEQWTPSASNTDRARFMPMDACLSPIQKRQTPAHRTSRMETRHLARGPGRGAGALERLDRLWVDLFPAEQVRTISLLVDRVDIT